MASSSFVSIDAPDQIYKWIERKPLAEAVLWTPREKFYLIATVMNYGSDWNTAVRILKKNGEPYRPNEWYTSASCEREFQNILSNQTNEIKSMEPCAMMKHMCETSLVEYEKHVQKAHDGYLAKYRTINSTMKHIMNGHLSRYEINSFNSQMRRNEIDGKKYMEQLQSRQNAYLASENSSSGTSEEPIKWNSPSAPLLTSLLRSRNTIPPNRNTTAITSQMQSPSCTSRTRSGKLLPLSPSVGKTTQGTPTLSKLLEAPANPYIPSPLQPANKLKSDIVGTDELNGDNYKKESSQPPSLIKAQVDHLLSHHGSLSQSNKSELSYSKRNTSISPVSAVKNGSKAISSVVSLLSDSEENDEDKSPSQNTHPKNLFIFGEKKEIMSSPGRIEQRATRSQTRAEGWVKQSNDNVQSDGKNESNLLSQQIEGSQINKGNLIDGNIDNNQIEIEPFFTNQDGVTVSPIVTRSSTQRQVANNSADNSSTKKANCKEVNNQSKDLILNSAAKNVSADYKNLMVGQSKTENTKITGCLIPVENSALKDTLMLQKDSQCLSMPSKTLTAFDGKLLKPNTFIELKNSSMVRCYDSKNDKILSFTNQPIVVVNKITKPFNIKLASEVRNTSDIKSFDTRKAFRYQSSSKNLTQLPDNHCSFSDEVINIDDDVNINVNNKKNEPLKPESQLINAIVGNDCSNILSASKSTSIQVDKKSNDKTLWSLSEKPQNFVDIFSKKLVNQDATTVTESNVQETSNRFIKELGFDFEQSTSISDLYNDEDIVKMHSFDNEDLSSLVVSDSLVNSETKKCQNTSGMADSSVSECNLTTGVFDTFAQITRADQTQVSKDIKSVNRESKTIEQNRKNLKPQSFIHVEEYDHSLEESVTSIHSQSVLSDVMNRINSDCDATLDTSENTKSVLINEIVEISSDEEETVCDDITIINVKQNKILECDKVNLKKLNESQTVNKLTTDLNVVNKKSETNILISKNVANNITNDTIKFDKENVKNMISNVLKKSMSNIVDEAENIQTEKQIEIIVEDPKINKLKSGQCKEYIGKRKNIDEFMNKSEINLQLDGSKSKQLELITNTKKPEESLFIEITERNQKEITNMGIKETKINEFEGKIVLRSKQNEESKAKTFETVKLKEAEIKTTKEVETKVALIEKPIKSKVNEGVHFQNIKELDVAVIEDVIQKNNTVETQNEHEILRAKENVDLQNVKEAEVLISNSKGNIPREIEAKRLKGTELKHVKEDEMPRSNEKIKQQGNKINLIKENEIKNVKRLEVAEVDIEEAKLVKLNDNAKPSVIKTKEVKIKSKSEDTEGKLLKEHKILPSEDQVKITIKSDQSTIHTNSAKNNTKEIESKLGKSNEQKQNVAENKAIQNVDAQTITRTRGFKVEDKLKESNLFHNVIFKPSVVLIKTKVPPKSDVGFSDHILQNENKCNPITRVLHYDSSGSSSENLNDVGSKSRTRSSSSFKQSKVVETSSSSSLNKSNDPSEPCTVLKTSLGTKTRISTNLDQGSPITSILQYKPSLSEITSSLKALSDNNRKDLRVSVEMLSADAVPLTSLLPKEICGHHKNNILIKQSNTKVVNNDHLPQEVIDNNDKLDKPDSKKRGRKRRLDQQNEDIPKPNWAKSSLQNGATLDINMHSTYEIELEAKRTKKYIESQENSIMSLERIKKMVLRGIFNSKCEGNQLYLTFEKQIENAFPEYRAILKNPSTPLTLNDIKNKIDCGEISNINDLQTELYMLQFNALMVNPNKFNSEVLGEENTNSNFQLLMGEDYEPGQKKTNNESSGCIDQLGFLKTEFSDTKSDDCNSEESESEDVTDKSINYEACFSDIDSDLESLISCEENDDTSDSSTSEYDSDHYSPEFF